MGMYTSLRFKGTVKPEFREDILSVIQEENWGAAKDDLIKCFKTIRASEFIPFGSLDDLPDKWVDETGSATDGFDHEYNVLTGTWIFQTSLNHYNTIIEFFKFASYFVESVDHAEVYNPEYTYSAKYELINGLIIRTNDEFTELY